MVAAGVWTPLRRPRSAIGIVLSLAYWVLGQSLGGPFWIEGATDFNSGPLFVLLAFALFPVVQANGSTPGEGMASSSSTYLPSTSTSATP